MEGNQRNMSLKFLFIEILIIIISYLECSNLNKKIKTVSIDYFPFKYHSLKLKNISVKPREIFYRKYVMLRATEYQFSNDIIITSFNKHHWNLSKDSAPTNRKLTGIGAFPAKVTILKKINGSSFAHLVVLVSMASVLIF